MKDEERIQMYYQTGLLDWKSEQQAEIIKKEKHLNSKCFSSFFNVFGIKRPFGAIIKKS